MTEAGDDSSCPAKGRKQVMSDKEIMTNIVNILVTNYDALALLLCYFSYLMAINPDIQEKLQSEIDNYFEDKQVSHS